MSAGPLCMHLHVYPPIYYVSLYLCFAKALAGGPRKTTIECAQEVYILFPENSIFFFCSCNIYAEP